MAAGVVRALAWCGVVALAAQAAHAEPHHGGVAVLRKGEGAPWGQYFSPGFGGYYTVDDFRAEPQVVVPVLPYQTYQGADDQQQLLQSPDYGQQVTQGPDLSQETQGYYDPGQMTQGPDLGQVTQGPEPGRQETQGPDNVQVTTYRPDVPDAQSTNQPDDYRQYTTQQPTTEYPTTEYPTTTDYVLPTTWRPRPQHGSCKVNPAAAGHAPGTRLLCTVEVCLSAQGVKGVKGSHGRVTTLVCRPFLGCDEPARTTDTPQYTTPLVYTEPRYTTASPEYPTSPPIIEDATPGYAVHEYTTPEPTTPPPPPPPTAPPGVKGGRNPYVPRVKGHRVQEGVKGGVHYTWDAGVEGLKGGRGSVNVPAYGGYADQWESISDWGVKTGRRRPSVGVKDNQHAKGQQQRHSYQFGGWGHQDYQEQPGLHIL